MKVLDPDGSISGLMAPQKGLVASASLLRDLKVTVMLVTMSIFIGTCCMLKNHLS